MGGGSGGGVGGGWGVGGWVMGVGGEGGWDWSWEAACLMRLLNLVYPCTSLIMVCYYKIRKLFLSFSLSVFLFLSFSLSFSLSLSVCLVFCISLSGSQHVVWDAISRGFSPFRQHLIATPSAFHSNRKCQNVAVLLT